MWQQRGWKKCSKYLNLRAGQQLENGWRRARGECHGGDVKSRPISKTFGRQMHSDRTQVPTATPKLCHGSSPLPWPMAVLPASSRNWLYGVRMPNPGEGSWRRSEVCTTWRTETSWLTSKWLCLAGLGSNQRRRSGLKRRLAWRVLVLPSSEFEHFFEEGPTELAYAGTPVSGLGHAQRG